LIDERIYHANYQTMLRRFFNAVFVVIACSKPPGIGPLEEYAFMAPRCHHETGDGSTKKLFVAHTFISGDHPISSL